MTGFVGMDVEAVQQAAVQLDQRSVQLRDLAHSLDSMMQQLQGAWQGHDAMVFVGWWQQQHRPALMACVEAIHGLAQSARNNSTEQAGVSGSGSGTGQAGSGHSAVAGPAVTGAAGVAVAGDVTQPRDWREVQTGYDGWATGYWANADQGQYQCTAWARYRWHELGYDLPNTALGNGWQMAGNVAATVGEPISTQPSLHAMASYGDGSNGNHVMIVEEVRADGTIRVSEMNTDNNWAVGLPNEYRDTSTLAKGPDGNYYRNGHQIRFAAIPS